ncbi:Hok/Gef family protein [Trabulsiella odontotermitis]|nr:Hok/Gef family protein [Trabulsiella odontotermitis]
MSQNLLAIIVLCMTILVFTWLERGSLCEMRVKLGGVEIAALLQYESRR